MKIDVKICGLRDQSSLDAAVTAGARYVGFVFYPKSLRTIDPETVRGFLERLPPDVLSVGLFVDPTDDDIIRVLRMTPLRMLQLHGSETPERVATLRTFTGLPVIKAIGIATAEDIEASRLYEPVADMLLLDAKAPVGGLPGGNATSFEWNLLKNIRFSIPWMLAGGLHEGNITDAIAATGASILDVSSGVEDAPGHKNIAKIKGFIDKSRMIETCC